MCLPAVALPFLGFLSTGLGIIGGIQQANAIEASAQATAKTERQQAEIADYQAKQAGTIGAIEEERHRQKVRLLQGKQRAAFAANYADPSSGTALDLTTETAAMGEEDAMMIRYNAQNEAWGYRARATNLRNQAKNTIAAGKANKTATLLGTAAGAMKGVQDGYGGWWGSDSQGGYIGSQRGKG